MGLFLQTAIIPQQSERTVRNAVLQLKGRHDLDPAECRYHQYDGGTAVLFNDGCCGYEALAEELSAALPAPVLLLYIYDEDFWGYFLYENRVELDRFNPMPDYFEEVSPEERRRCAGNPALIAQRFGVKPEDISRYLRIWTDEELDRYDEKSYPDDQAGQCDCWQMADFMGKLGFPWPFDGEEEEKPVPPQLTLEEILSAPPRPPRTAEQARKDGVHTLANLPSALSGEYIRTILTPETAPLVALLGSAKPQDAYDALLAGLDPEHPDPFRCMLMAYCAYRSGSDGFAYGTLYRALLPSLFPSYRNDDKLSEHDTIMLLRARGLMVAATTKRHIAVKDLTRLRRLDPDNEDVYLLALAYFHYIDTYWNASHAPARADLEELFALGFPKEGDPRINWAGFSEDFWAFVRKVGRNA